MLFRRLLPCSGYHFSALNAVNTENPYPILDLFPDLLMLTGLRKVVVLPAVTIFKCHLPGNFLRLNFSSNSLLLRKMIPYSRPNSLISIPYSRVNSLKTIPFTAAHTYIAHRSRKGQLSKLFTVANLPLVINSVGKPNIRFYSPLADAAPQFLHIFT